MTVLPELFEQPDPAVRGNSGAKAPAWVAAALQTALEAAALCAGVGMMVLVAQLEVHGH